MMNEQKPAEYSLPGVMRYLQTEWQRNEHDRIQWELERAEMKIKIGRLEGEKRGLQLQLENLAKKTALLETSLDVHPSKDPLQQARTKFDTIAVDAESHDSLDLTPLINSRKYLEKCVQDVSYLLQSAASLYPEESAFQGAVTSSRLPTFSRSDSSDSPVSGTNLNSNNANPAATNGNVGLPLPPLPPPPAPKKASKSTSETTTITSPHKDQETGARPSLKLRHTLKSADSIRAIDFLDADTFLLANDEGTIHMYSTASSDDGSIVVAPRMLRNFKGHKGIVCSIKHDSAANRLFSAGQDHKIRVWDINAPVGSNACTSEVAAHSDVIWQLDYLESRKLLASGSSDGLVKLWDVKTGGKLVHKATISTIDHGAGAVLSLAFPKTGDRLYVGCENGRILQIDLEMGVIVYEFEVNSKDSSIKALQCVPSNTAIMAGLSDGTVAEFDPTSGSCNFRAKKHNGAVTALAVCPSDELVWASGGDDGLVRIWKVDGQVQSPNQSQILSSETTLEKHSSPEGVLGINWYSPGLLATYGGDSTARLYYGSK